MHFASPAGELHFALSPRTSMQITPSLMVRSEAEISEQLTFLKSLYTETSHPEFISGSKSNKSEIPSQVHSDNRIYLHLDIMDGQFIPATTPLDYSSITDMSLTFDVHMMAKDPSALLAKLPKAKFRYVFCHAELEQDVIDQFFADCIDKGIYPGLAVNPETTFEKIPFINLLTDYELPIMKYPSAAILLMSVTPGDSGRQFDPNVVAKINQIKSSHPDIFVTVDGGINSDTIKQIFKADCAVAHNAIFNAKDPQKEFELLQIS